MYEKDGKKYPFKIDEYYSPGLNSLKRIYTQHPKFNGNVRLIYELLFDHWNAEYGYAFPDQWQLAIESGLGLSTVKRCINVLVELDLIEKRRSPIGKKNNVYYIKKPVTTLEELYKKFPEIKEESQKKIADKEAEREKDMKKWKKHENKDEKGAPTPQPRRKTVVIYPKKVKEENLPNDELKEIADWLQGS